ncbi:MAG: MFS transporter [Chitinophagales bacterium]|nr:MFS transporter [Chitinophagales bacterium]
MSKTRQASHPVISTTVIVAALGYFVDIYDLQLFNLVSKASLRGIGITDEALVDKYDYMLFLYQMAGMLAGGILWGILGDKKGRKSILFGSIVMYSVANILNGFVVNVEQYAVIRFFAGLGLAGELGAAITLVSETIETEKRGWGTMLIVTVGALGAVAANLIAQKFPWQISYFIGGGLGLLLLLLRVGTFESGMFDKMKSADVVRGNFGMLFTNRERFVKYLFCIFVGLPVWYCIGVLIKFSETFASVVGITEGNVKVGNAIMFAYIGLSVGDLLSGTLSQVFRSRKKVVAGYLFGTIVLVVIYLFYHQVTATWFYFMCFMLGCATGYWALFVTIAAEQFGTNIRATVATTVPNFVRGANIPLILSYKALEPTVGSIEAALVVGAIAIGLALLAIFSLKETFTKNLDYLEHP